MATQLHPKLLTTIVLLILGVYLSSYIVLSARGQYEADVLVMDKVNESSCICLAVFEFWQPHYISWATYKESLYANSMGYVFYPLIIFDQKFWHPDKKIEDREMTPQEMEDWKKAWDERRLRKND